MIFIMSKEIANKAILFALRNEDDSYDKNAKLENLNDGAGLTFIGLTEKYDEHYLKNAHELTIKQLAELYQQDRKRTIEIIKDAYYDLYWAKEFDAITDERITIRLFDLMLNRGRGGLNSILGAAGYKLTTINDNIKTEGAETVYDNIIIAAEKAYRSLRQFNRFGEGWLNRLKRNVYKI